VQGIPNRPSRIVQFTASLFVLIAFAASARADIFQWEYINPADLSWGKQQSTTLAPDGAGVDAVPDAKLNNRNLRMAYLIGVDLTDADLSQVNLANAILDYATLTGVDFSQANLSHANFFGAAMTGSELRDADIRGADFAKIIYPDEFDPRKVYEYGTGITPAQLYSTASYQAYDLRGIGLGRNYLNSVNFAGQNLTNANFTGASLTDADFTGALVQGARFGRPYSYFRIDPGTGISLAQLYATASYQVRGLSSIDLQANNLVGGNFARQNLAHAKFDGATITGADFREAKLTNATFYDAALTGAYFFDADLGNVNFQAADLTGAEFSGADIHDANFNVGGGCGEWTCNPRGSGITLTQLYSTSSYNDRDLSDINFSRHNFARGNFAGQNLTNSNFSETTLTDADFTGADVRGANFASYVYCYKDCTFGTGLTLAQLYSTASYQARDLTGIDFGYNDLTGGSFAGQNLTNADFSAATLTGADLSAADARGAILYSSDLLTTNLIRPDGHISGLELGAGSLLVIGDYDGNPISIDGNPIPRTPIPITVEQHMEMAPGGTLRMVFEADAWDSTISFAPGIPVNLGGTLELTFAADVNPTSQIGRAFNLFNWTGVNPTGAFSVASPYAWDLSNLYTTGQVTLLSVPEPSALLLFGLALAKLVTLDRFRYSFQSIKGGNP
jgi:uncharacterized protein YjbI with pentapeptide repeats